MVGGLTQVFLGGGDHPDIQRDQLVAAQTLNHALLQQTQELDLYIQAHAFDFVEEQCPAIGELEFADTAFLRAGKGAGFMAEQFAFDHRLGQRPGVDRNERAVAAARQVVQRPCDDFFTRAGFAQNQHVCLGPGKGADLFAQAQHGRRLPHQSCAQLLAIAERQAQAAVVQHQCAQGQGTAHAVEQGVAGKGFFQKVVSARAHGLHRQGHITMAGNQQHRQLGVLRVQVRQQLQPVHARHADVTDHHARPVSRDAFSQAIGFGQRQHFKPGQVQGLAERLAQVRIIIDQDDLYARINGLAHDLESSEACKLTPGAPARSRRVIKAPPSLWLANNNSPPNARINVSQMASPRPNPWVRVLVV